MSEIKVNVETITPEIALEMLSHHLDYNRTVNMQTVDKLVRDIQNGNWQLIPYPISIAKDGTVIDGQHRLTAIARSGRSVDCFVARNVPNTKEVFLSIDTGRSRSFADAMRVIKSDDAMYRNTSVSAFARLLSVYERGYALTASVKFSNAEVLSAIDKYQNIVRYIFAFNSRHTKTISGVGFYFAIASARICGVAEKDILAFFNCINENEIGDEKYNWKSALKFKEDYVKFGWAMKSRITLSAVETQKALYEFINGSRKRTDELLWKATPYQFENYGKGVGGFISKE